MKTVLPHMAPLAALSTFALAGFGTQNDLQRALGAVSPIPFMKLKPEHVTELTTGIATFVGELQESKVHDKQFTTTLISELNTASNQLIAHNGNGGVHTEPANPGHTAGAHA